MTYFCQHDIDVDDDICLECFRRSELEKEAEREAWFQHNVIGPMFGFDKEGEL